MDDGIREAAERKFEEARAAANARDPRDFYRDTLRQLKEANPDGYEKAVLHFQETLVPSIASGEAEPLSAWREYGCLLADLMGPGRTMAVDDSGKASPYDPRVSLDRLVLHLPDDKNSRAILVSLPPEPSPAQLATYRLLVKGKQRLDS